MSTSRINSGAPGRRSASKSQSDSGKGRAGVSGRPRGVEARDLSKEPYLGWTDYQNLVEGDYEFDFDQDPRTMRAEEARMIWRYAFGFGLSMVLFFLTVGLFLGWAGK